MRVNAVVPIKEAFNVNLVSDFEVLYSLVNVCIRTAEIGLYKELICFAVKRYVEVEVVAFCACTVPLVEICNFLIVSVFGSGYCESLE